MVLQAGESKHPRGPDVSHDRFWGRRNRARPNFWVAEIGLPPISPCPKLNIPARFA
jgi:hypothetical protein